MTQATTLQTLIQGTLPGKTHHKNFRNVKHQIPQELQTDFKNSLIPRTITHSNWSPSLRSQFWTNTSSLHTPLNPALSQPTLPLSNPLFDKSNIICPMRASPKSPTILYCHQTFHGHQYHVSPTLLFCYKHRAYQTTWFGLRQWIYWTTCPYSCTRSTSCTKPRAHTRPINSITIPLKDTMITYMAQPHYFLNSQVLTIFFLFPTTPATPHYPEFTDRYFHTMVDYRFHCVSSITPNSFTTDNFTKVY